MKKIYIPTDDTLSRMQELGINVEDYLTIKRIELAILKGLKKKSILKGLSDDEMLREDIVRSICHVYPKEIEYSYLASRDEELLEKLLMNYGGMKLGSLDMLSYFEDDIQYKDRIAKETITLLAEELRVRPQYRFEYKESSLLDSIFSTDILNNLEINDYKTENDLARIDPAYAVLLPNVSLADLSSISFFGELTTNELARRKTLARYGMLTYSERYNYTLSEEQNNENNKNLDKENINRLTKTLRKNKKISY